MALADVRAEIPRTFFHVLGGAALAAVAHLAPEPWGVAALGATFLAAVAVDFARLRWHPLRGRFVRHLGPLMRPSEHEGLTGAPAFTGGVFLAYLLFPQAVALSSVVPLLVGDRAGLLVGKGFGRIRIGDKTLEGSAACFLASFAALLVLGRAWPALVPFGPWLLLGASAAGTAAEALPRPFDDNLTIPLAAGAFLTLAS